MPAGTELTGAGERPGGEGGAVSRGPKYTPARQPRNGVRLLKEIMKWVVGFAIFCSPWVLIGAVARWWWGY